MSLVYLYKNRTTAKDIVILDADSAAITPGASDLVRATIQRDGETAVFTVTSGTNTANGSSFGKGASNRLKIMAADLASVDPGTYSLLVDFYDSADGQWKTVDRQCCVLENT